MSEFSTCKTCSEDYLTEDMIEDIQGALYCLMDSDICASCGYHRESQPEFGCDECGLEVSE